MDTKFSHSLEVDSIIILHERLVSSGVDFVEFPSREVLDKMDDQSLALIRRKLAFLARTPSGD